MLFHVRHVWRFHGERLRTFVTFVKLFNFWSSWQRGVPQEGLAKVRCVAEGRPNNIKKLSTEKTMILETVQAKCDI